MFEVDIDVAGFGQDEKALYKCAYLSGSVRSGAAEPKAGVCGGGVDLGRSKVVAFSNAERGVVGAENGINLLTEPGFVAELEGDGRGASDAESRSFEEGGEACPIGPEVRWKLEEDEAELAGLADGLKNREEEGDVIGAVGEPLDVGDTLRRLEAEAEERLAERKPVFDHLGGGQSAKSIVDLDRAELRGVIL